MLKFSFPDVEKYRKWSKQLDEIRIELGTKQIADRLTGLEFLAKATKALADACNSFGVSSKALSSRVSWVLTPRAVRRRSYPIKREIRSFKLK